MVQISSKNDGSLQQNIERVFAVVMMQAVHVWV